MSAAGILSPDRIVAALSETKANGGVPTARQRMRAEQRELLERATDRPEKSLENVLSEVAYAHREGGWEDRWAKDKAHVLDRAVSMTRGALEGRGFEGRIGLSRAGETIKGIVEQGKDIDRQVRAGEIIPHRGLKRMRDLALELDTLLIEVSREQPITPQHPAYVRTARQARGAAFPGPERASSSDDGANLAASTYLSDSSTDSCSTDSSSSDSSGGCD